MPTGSTVLQNGFVTPGHLASWTTDGIVQDAGVSFANTYGKFVSNVLGINFNASNSDTPIPILLPAGYSRYRIEQIIISGPTAALNTATCGVFTATGGGGTAVVTSGTGVTITSTTP